LNTTVELDLERRLDLYARAFELCRKNGLDLERFIRLVPDRLPIVSTDEHGRIRIPAGVDPALAARWQTLFLDLPVLESSLTDVEEIRRTLHVSKLDSRIDPVALAAWWRRSAADALASFSQIYLEGFGEVRRGQGGEDAAYLVHLFLVASLRRIVGRGAWPVLVAELLDRTIEGLVASDRLREPSLSARLGYRVALTLSPFALGATREALSQSPLGRYRTTRDALRFAARVLVPPIEDVPLATAASAIAERLAADPKIADGLHDWTRLDQARDLAMLALLEVWDARKASVLEPLARFVTSDEARIRALKNARQRAELLEAIARGTFGTARALDALADLVERDRVSTGADLERRAKSAAIGAILLSLDERVSLALHDMLQPLDTLSGETALLDHANGRAYLLSSDRPLYRLSKRHHEASLHVELRSLMRGTEARVFAELLELCDRVQSPAGDAIRIARIDRTSLIIRGDISAIVELAFLLRAAVPQLAPSLAGLLALVLHGEPAEHAVIDGGQLGRFTVDLPTKREEAAIEQMRADVESEMSISGAFACSEDALEAFALARDAVLELSEEKVRHATTGAEVRARVLRSRHDGRPLFSFREHGHGLWALVTDKAFDELLS
jgi:hypothetical protein